MGIASFNATKAAVAALAFQAVVSGISGVEGFSTPGASGSAPVRRDGKGPMDQMPSSLATPDQRAAGNSLSELGVPPALQEGFSACKDKTVRDLWPNLCDQYEAYFREKMEGASKGLHQGKGQETPSKKTPPDLHSKEMTPSNSIRRRPMETPSQEHRAGKRTEVPEEEIVKSLVGYLKENPEAWKHLKEEIIDKKISKQSKNLIDDEKVVKDSKNFEKNKEVGKFQFPEVKKYCEPYRSYASGRRDEHLIYYYNCCKDALGISHCEHGRKVDWVASFAYIGLCLGGTILWALKEPIYNELARFTSSCGRRATAIKNFCMAPPRLLSWGRAADADIVVREQSERLRRRPYDSIQRRQDNGMQQRPYGNGQWEEISMTSPHQMYSDTIPQSLRKEQADVPARSRAKAPSRFHDYPRAISSQIGENILPSNAPGTGLDPTAPYREAEANPSANSGQKRPGKSSSVESSRNIAKRRDLSSAQGRTNKRRVGDNKSSSGRDDMEMESASEKRIGNAKSSSGRDDMEVKSARKRRVGDAKSSSGGNNMEVESARKRRVGDAKSSSGGDDIAKRDTEERPQRTESSNQSEEDDIMEESTRKRPRQTESSNQSEEDDAAESMRKKPRRTGSFN